MTNKNHKPMTIREYAKANNHMIIGKLRYVGKCDSHIRLYMDDMRNEYIIDSLFNSMCIVTIDGAVI